MLHDMIDLCHAVSFWGSIKLSFLRTELAQVVGNTSSRKQKTYLHGKVSTIVPDDLVPQGARVFLNNNIDQNIPDYFGLS